MLENIKRKIKSKKLVKLSNRHIKQQQNNLKEQIDNFVELNNLQQENKIKLLQQELDDSIKKNQDLTDELNNKIFNLMLNNNEDNKIEINQQELENITKQIRNSEKITNQKTNADPSFNFISYGKMGYNIDNIIKSNYNNFLNVATKSSPFIFSQLGDVFQSWIYKKYSIANKIISYFINKGFSNMCLKYDNDEKNLDNEEIKQIKDFVLPYNKQFKKIIGKIITGLIVVEKYGGGYFIIKNNNSVFDLIIKNRFEKLTKTKETIFFVNDNEEYKIEDVIKIPSSNQPDTNNYKQLLKGWGFGWFDLNWYSFSYIVKLLAIINETASKQQFIFFKTPDVFAETSLTGVGRSAQKILNQLNDSTNNSTFALRSDEEVGFLNSNFDLEKAMEIVIKATTFLFSVPRKALDDSSGGGIDNGNHTESSNLSDIKVNEKISFYNTYLQQIVNKIVSTIPNTNNNYTTDNIIIDYRPPKQLTQQEELEKQEKEAQIALIKAQTKEIEARFNNVGYNKETDF